MKRYAINLSLLLIAFSCLHPGCKETPTEPPPKDPRTYTWVVDSIAYPGSFQTSMQDIWGSSPSNVYVVGHNESPGPGTMFHYNGVRWSTTGFHAAEGGSISGAVSLSAIYGFGPNDIYAVGERIKINPNPPPNFLDSSLIIHFNGATWTEFKVVGGRMLQAVFGSAPNDIWAGGIEGTIFHFDGSTWSKVDMAHDIWLNAFGGSSTNAYALGYALDVGVGDTTWHHFLSWDRGRWNIVDSFPEVVGYTPTFGQASLALINAGLYSSGRGIFLRSSGQWQNIFKDPDDEFFRNVYGTSASSLFAVGGVWQGMVYHFNGQDWFRFAQFNFTGYSFDAVWTDGKEVFVVGSNSMQSVVLHGR